MYNYRLIKIVSSDIENISFFVTFTSSTQVNMASQDSFAHKRACFAQDVLDSHFSNAEIRALNPAAHRDFWSAILELITTYHTKQLGDKQCVNDEEARIEFEAMINSFAEAKDHSFRYLLAYACEKHKCENEDKDMASAREHVKILLESIVVRNQTRDVDTEGDPYGHVKGVKTIILL